MEMPDWCCGTSATKHAQVCTGEVVYHPTRRVNICQECGKTVV